jgi:hypothetical protein
MPAGNVTSGGHGISFHSRTNRENTMFTFIILPTILIFVAVSLVLRLIFVPLWNPYRLRRPYFGPYGYYGYGRGYRRHHFPGGLLSMLLVALSRIIGRRW